MSKAQKPITILGGGVSGLTTGVLLLEEGFDVTILAEEIAQNTVSAVAAAIWFPYAAKPAEKVNSWSKVTYQKFEELSKIEHSGVSFVPFSVIEQSEENPDWLTALPPSIAIQKEQKIISEKECVSYTMLLPLIETPIYLRYLQSEFSRLGGNFIQKKITEISDLDTSSVTVNCIGLGSKQLFNDSEVYPIQGQVVKLSPSSSIQGFSFEFPFDEFSDELVYVIPRKDCIVVGGSAKENQFTTTPSEALKKRILERAISVKPELQQLEVQETVVGLRPGRTSVRLEWDAELPLIHNYGHGGAGYTVSWGCAESVYDLIQTMS